jgi:predicted DNA-binding ribbon-helix-helix protein
VKAILSLIERAPNKKLHFSWLVGKTPELRGRTNCVQYLRLLCDLGLLERREEDIPSFRHRPYPSLRPKKRAFYYVTERGRLLLRALQY